MSRHYNEFLKHFLGERVNEKRQVIESSFETFKKLTKEEKFACIKAYKEMQSEKIDKVLHSSTSI